MTTAMKTRTGPELIKPVMSGMNAPSCCACCRGGDNDQVRSGNADYVDRRTRRNVMVSRGSQVVGLPGIGQQDASVAAGWDGHRDMARLADQIGEAERLGRLGALQQVEHHEDQAGADDAGAAAEQRSPPRGQLEDLGAEEAA